MLYFKEDASMAYPLVNEILELISKSVNFVGLFFRYLDVVETEQLICLLQTHQPISQSKKKSISTGKVR